MITKLWKKIKKWYQIQPLWKKIVFGVLFCIPLGIIVLLVVILINNKKDSIFDSNGNSTINGNGKPINGVANPMGTSTIDETTSIEISNVLSDIKKDIR